MRGDLTLAVRRRLSSGGLVVRRTWRRLVLLLVVASVAVVLLMVNWLVLFRHGVLLRVMLMGLSIIDRIIALVLTLIAVVTPGLIRGIVRAALEWPGRGILGRLRPGGTSVHSRREIRWRV